MRERDITGLPWLNAERDADQCGVHVIQTGGFGIHRKQSGLRNFFDPLLQGLLIQNLLIIGGRSFQFSDRFKHRVCRLQFLQPALKLKTLVQLGERLNITFLLLQFFQFKIQLNIQPDGGKLVGHRQKIQ